MTKRLIFMTIALVLCTVAVACSAPATPSPSQEPETSEMPEAEQGGTFELAPPGDMSEGGDVPVAEIPSAQPAQSAAFSLETDMGINIDGTWYAVLTDAAPLLEIWGEHTLHAAPSCVYDSGDDKEFEYEGFSLFTNPVDGKDIWYDLLVTGEGIETARGIKVGDSVDDVMAAYGDSYYWEGDTVLTYSVSGVEGDYESPCIMFGVEDGKITQFNVYYPTNTV